MTSGPDYEKTTPQKVFAKPFRIVLKKREDLTVTWIEVKTLKGLRTVCDRVASGELIPVDAYATLDRQLWGHLAEHVGFLRYEGPADEFSAGIQPAGESFGELVGDLSTFFGKSEDVLSALSEMRDHLRREAENAAPHVESTSFGKFVKSDGVNLTTEGEQFLAERLQVSGIEREADNAAILTDQSEPGLTSEEMDRIASESGEQDQGAGGLGGDPTTSE